MHLSITVTVSNSKYLDNVHKKKIHLVRPLDSKLNLKLEGTQVSEMLIEFIED